VSGLRWLLVVLGLLGGPIAGAEQLQLDGVDVRVELG